MTSIEARKRLAKLIQQFAERAYPMPLRRAKVVMEFVDGAEEILAVSVLATPPATLLPRGSKSGRPREGIRQKILRGIPSYDDKPMGAKEIAARCECKCNSRFRAELGKLVEEKKVEKDNNAYKLANELGKNPATP